MSSQHMDFVSLDRASKRDGQGVIDDSLAEWLDHRLDVAAVHVRHLADLQARQVQADEVEADDPRPQGLVMAGEDAPGQAAEPPPTAWTGLALATLLGVVAPILDDRLGRAMGTGDPLGSTHLADDLEAFGVVDEVSNVNHWSVP